MELMLNELSISPPSSDKYQANDKMIQFAQTVNQARQKGSTGDLSKFPLWYDCPTIYKR